MSNHLMTWIERNTNLTIVKEMQALVVLSTFLHFIVVYKTVKLEYVKFYGGGFFSLFILQIDTLKILMKLLKVQNAYVSGLDSVQNLIENIFKTSTLNNNNKQMRCFYLI